MDINIEIILVHTDVILIHFANLFKFFFYKLDIFFTKFLYQGINKGSRCIHIAVGRKDLFGPFFFQINDDAVMAF